MGIVINEFEAVAEAPVPPTPREGEMRGDESKGAQRPDPRELQFALRELTGQLARVWAH